MLTCPGPHCLVIDADPQIREESLAALRAARLVARGAETLAAAVAHCRLVDFDVVLCAEEMGGLEGRIVAGAIRRIPWQAQVPILFTNPFQRAAVISRQSSAGCEFHLRPPLDAELLLELAERCRSCQPPRRLEPRPIRELVNASAASEPQGAAAWLPAPHLPAFRQVLAEMLVAVP